jgi:hypothetical protein
MSTSLLNTNFNFNFNFKEIFLEGKRVEMLKGASEMVRIKEWIDTKAVAKLAEYPPANPREVAKLCLYMATSSPDEVTVLLWNGKVAEAAMELMQEISLGETPETRSAGRAGAANGRQAQKLPAAVRAGPPVGG